MRSISFYVVFVLGVIFMAVAKSQISCNCVETVTVTAAGTDCPFIPLQVSVSQPGTWSLGATGPVASPISSTESVSTTVTETRTTTRVITLSSAGTTAAAAPSSSTPATDTTTVPDVVIPAIDSTGGITLVTSAASLSDVTPFVGTDGVLHTSGASVFSSSDSVTTVTVTPVPNLAAPASSKFPSLIIVGGQGIDYTGYASGNMTGTQMGTSVIWSSSTLVLASSTSMTSLLSSARYWNITSTISASSYVPDSTISSTMSMVVSSTQSTVESSTSLTTSSSTASSTISSTSSTSAASVSISTTTMDHGSFITFTPTMTVTGEITIPVLGRRFFQPKDAGMTFSLIGTPVNSNSGNDISERTSSTLSTVVSAIGAAASED